MADELIKVSTLNEWYSAIAQCYAALKAENSTEYSREGLPTPDSASGETIGNKLTINKINELIKNINPLDYKSTTESNLKVYFGYADWTKYPISEETSGKKILAISRDNLDTTILELQKVCVNNTKEAKIDYVNIPCTVQKNYTQSNSTLKNNVWEDSTKSDLTQYWDYSNKTTTDTTTSDQTYIQDQGCQTQSNNTKTTSNSTSTTDNKTTSNSNCSYIGGGSDSDWGTQAQKGSNTTGTCGLNSRNSTKCSYACVYRYVDNAHHARIYKGKANNTTYSISNATKSTTCKTYDNKTWSNNTLLNQTLSCQTTENTTQTPELKDLTEGNETYYNNTQYNATLTNSTAYMCPDHTNDPYDVTQTIKYSVRPDKGKTMQCSTIDRYVYVSSEE